MTIEQFRAENFRCLESVELQLDARYNQISGANASGKTSLLEALAYLGRGRSFRGSSVQELVRRGTKEFVVYGRVRHAGRSRKLGVRNGREGLEIRVDQANGTAADLAEVLPLQVVDPNVHELIGGGPEVRRRFVDWIAFHVEHEFLGVWRQFRRTLKQRNAALKSGQGFDAWTAEFVDLGMRVDALRRQALAGVSAGLEKHAQGLLGETVRFEYRSGWPDELSLAEALATAAARDRELGSSQVGPHRGDLLVTTKDRRARNVVSRGQQKLLACGMILAATEAVQAKLGEPMLLLLDDPAAELDRQALDRLMGRVFDLECQVVATALEAGALIFPGKSAVFHVEHGQVTAA